MSGIALRGGLLAALSFAAGCGDRSPIVRPPDVWLLARWHEAPATAAEIGYELKVEIGSRNREGQCTRPPPADLQVIVNDREATSEGSGGACDWNVVFQLRGVTAPGSVSLRVSDALGDVGEASFDDVLPGPPGLIEPALGRVNAGEQVTVAVSAVFGAAPISTARFYWLDSPPSAGPAFTESPAELASDGSTATTTVPRDGGAGRTLLVFDAATFANAAAGTCAGLSSCTSTVERVLGPVELEVSAPSP